MYIVHSDKIGNNIAFNCNTIKIIDQLFIFMPTWFVFTSQLRMVLIRRMRMKNSSSPSSYHVSMRFSSAFKNSESNVQIGEIFITISCNVSSGMIARPNFLFPFATAFLKSYENNYTKLIIQRYKIIHKMSITTFYVYNSIEGRDISHEFKKIKKQRLSCTRTSCPLHFHAISRFSLPCVFFITLQKTRKMFSILKYLHKKYCTQIAKSCMLMNLQLYIYLPQKRV